jgi:phosphoribosyl 1,2-cyclic phosphodiesterase
MSVQFAVLASGSRGNATLVRAGCGGLLIDLGLGPRTLHERLAQVGSGWGQVAAVVLTHTHGDHVQKDSLRWLAREGITLHCHEGHCGPLSASRGFRALARLGLVSTFDDRPFLVRGGFQVEAIPLSHDGGPTFGFRVEGRSGPRARAASVGYVADTGVWDDRVADALTNVDLLGVEFNHDVDLQRRSGRPQSLIARVLGDQGHLSNEQGAALVSDVLRRSDPGRTRHLVLLHLSQQCNRPELALAAARAAVRPFGRRPTMLAARQDEATVEMLVRRRRASNRIAGTSPAFPWEQDQSSQPPDSNERAGYLFCQ